MLAYSAEAVLEAPDLPVSDVRAFFTRFGKPDGRAKEGYPLERCRTETAGCRRRASLSASGCSPLEGRPAHRQGLESALETAKAIIDVTNAGTTSARVRLAKRAVTYLADQAVIPWLRPRHTRAVRAVVVHEFGLPGVLVATEVPDPAPAVGEALIDVEVANVTFVETQVRAGKPPHPSMLPPVPAILGNGVGGVVSAVGSGVDPTWLGRRVVSGLRGTGGYAGRAVAQAAQLIEIPSELRTDEAVALLADGRTAMLLVRFAAIRPWETVLVEAAAGGVGSLLVQLARNAEARVAGAAGGARKLGVARELGASVLVDYNEPGWANRLRDEVGGLDVIFDGVGGSIGRTAFELLRPGGRFCPFGMSSGAFAQVDEADAEKRQIRLIRPARQTPDELRELVQAALAEAVAGRLRPLIGQRFPLERAADAHAAMEQRSTIGKTLLLVSPDDRAPAP